MAFFCFDKVSAKKDKNHGCRKKEEHAIAGAEGERVQSEKFQYVEKFRELECSGNFLLHAENMGDIACGQQLF